MTLKNINDIMLFLDDWVAKHGSYVNEGLIPGKASKRLNFFHVLEASKLGIQQVRDEIKEFIEVILNKGSTDNILEIGLGYYGGTHILWQQIFNQVVTIELNPLVALKFKISENLNGKDKIILGNSHKSKTWDKVYKYAQYDVLFIDADHTYEGIKSDYLDYAKLVKKNGIIAFHDSVCRVEGFGIAEFLMELAQGNIDNVKHNIHQIVHSKCVGIAYVES
ncbi:MAG: class I SAM-dependent methyltransferase [Lutibacter sp.]|jgi:hypothetical protein